jgi:hypothetical protein
MFAILRNVFDDENLAARAETPQDGFFDRTAYRHPYSDMHKVKPLLYSACKAVLALLSV